MSALVLAMPFTATFIAAIIKGNTLEGAFPVGTDQFDKRSPIRRLPSRTFKRNRPGKFSAKTTEWSNKPSSFKSFKIANIICGKIKAGRLLDFVY